MIVKARPLKKLCEYEGQQLPKHYKSDCYNDVDETEFACKEKHRIMVKLIKLNSKTCWRSGRILGNCTLINSQVELLANNKS